jgi:hypothetical protein
VLPKCPLPPVCKRHFRKTQNVVRKTSKIRISAASWYRILGKEFLGRKKIHLWFDVKHNL